MYTVLQYSAEFSLISEEGKEQKEESGSERDVRVRARKRGRTGKEIVAALREPVSLKRITMKKKTRHGSYRIRRGGDRRRGREKSKGPYPTKPQSHEHREGRVGGWKNGGWKGRGRQEQGRERRRDEGVAGRERGRGTEGALD